jgi:hypothetical protein
MEIKDQMSRKPKYGIYLASNIAGISIALIEKKEHGWKFL